MDEEHPNIGNAKKLKPNSAEGQPNFLGPVGTIWDSVNWSCTYDALFTILYYIWTTNPHMWNREFGALNPGAALLAETYCKVFDGTYTSEQSRDIVRAYLNNKFPNKFPYGHRSTVLAEVIREVLSSAHGLYVWSRCVVCGTAVEELGHQHMLTFEHIDRGAMTTSEIMRKGMRTRCYILPCSTCGGQMQDSADFVKAPKLISVFIDA